VHHQAPEALALAADWAERRRDFSQALETYTALVEMYRWSEQAPKAQFHTALNQYRLGQYSQAAASWRLGIERYHWYRPQASRFWSGKASWASGDDGAALDQWQSLVDLAPEGYYALRAASVASGAGLELQDPLAEIQSGPRDQSAAEEWLRSWLPVAETANLRALPAQLLQDPAYIRGTALLRLGMRTAALRHLEQVRSRWLHDGQVMYGLALRFRDLGTYGLSVRCAARLLDLSPVAERAAVPPFLQELVYPVYFSDLVEEEARAVGFDPMLILAVIRQESLFEPQALSYAGARGLMQIMPATGEWVADQMGSMEHTDDHLDRACISVRFGVHYLRYARDFAGGNLMMALVGYNAGPGNALYWRNLAGEEDDLLLETITNPQPQDYVRGVLQQESAYRRLYPAID
jgi:soluble lytic murein transglycosylase